MTIPSNSAPKFEDEDLEDPGDQSDFRSRSVSEKAKTDDLFGDRP